MKLFREGQITWDHLHTVGAPSETMLADLERRSGLVESDWYLNRAIEKAMIAFGWRTDLHLWNTNYARDDAYRFRAGWKKLCTYLKTRPELTATARGLVADPAPHGTSAMMEIEQVETEAHYLDWAETLWPMYLAAQVALHRYKIADDDVQRADVIAAAAEDALVHPEIARGLKLRVRAPIS